MILLPASDYTLDELTQAYNQTRTDYLIPMPMNPDRLNEYITLYDVDLPSSRVAVVGETIVGLGMLGRRPGQGWIPRLGGLPGAVLGAFVLGGLEILLKGLLPSPLTPYRDAFVFVVLIALLLFRPNGILGDPSEEKL